jgi:ribosomal protein L37AE/L43A
MKIIAHCPFCGSNWLLEQTQADKRTRCKKCQNLFKVPNLQDVPKAVKILKQAKGIVYVDQLGRIYG